MQTKTTSAAAYQDLVESGQVAMRQRQILQWLSRYRTLSFSRRELSHQIGMELCSVTGRVNELIARGLLEEDSWRRCTITGRTVNPVRITEAGIQALTPEQVAA